MKPVNLTPSVLPNFVGANPTGLSISQLKSLGQNPSLYHAVLSHGMASDVFRVDSFAVKLFRDVRRLDPVQATAIDVADAMMLLRFHPNIEQVKYAHVDEDVALIISQFQPNLTTIASHESGLHLLTNNAVMTQLISTILFMDIKGVLHRDLNEWGIEFDTNTGEPFILDFDKSRLMHWDQGNISLEQLAYGFERDNSTLLQELLNIDNFKEGFLMEMCLFHHELKYADRAGAISLFCDTLQREHDKYCDALIKTFDNLGRRDLAKAIQLRKERLSYWLDEKCPWRIAQLYNRKRMHFLMRAVNWATESSEAGAKGVVTFRSQALELLNHEIQIQSNRADGLFELHPHPLLYKNYSVLTSDSVDTNAPMITRGETTSVCVDYVSGDLRSLKRPDGQIRFAYIGDIHGRIQRLSKIGTLVGSLRDNGGLDALFSLGDNVEGGESVGTLFEIINMMNQMMFTASAVGNHDFDYHDLDYVNAGLKDLKERIAILHERYMSGDLSAKEYKKLIEAYEMQKQALVGDESILAEAISRAKFPFMVSNLTFENGSALQQLYDSKSIIPGAVTEINGHLVLYIGLTSPDLIHEFSYHEQKGFNHSASVVEGNLKKRLHHKISVIKDLYKGRSVTTVLLSHCGLPLDQKLASPDIDLILGAHTHNQVYKIVDHGSRKTHIVHAGLYCLMLGIVDFRIGDKGNIQNISHTLVDIERSRIKLNEKYQEIAESSDLRSLNSEVIGSCAEKIGIEGKSTRSTALMNIVTDAVRRMSGTDVSVDFAGNIRDGLYEGYITEADLRAVLPFPNKVRCCEISGAALCEMIEYSLDVSKNGSGKRSLLLHFSGLNYKVDAKGSLSEVLIDRGNGYEHLDSKGSYTMSYPDFMETGLGKKFPLHEISRRNRGVTLDFTVRDALCEEIRMRKVLDNRTSARIIIDPSAPLKFNNPDIVY
ncbi:MAG: 5'-nucleotidase C-terminal domain-containing protein [Pseudomonadota bacterium]